MSPRGRCQRGRGRSSRSHPTTRAKSRASALAPNELRVLNGPDLARRLLRQDSGVQVPWITTNGSTGGFIGKVLQSSEERYGFASTMVMRADLYDVFLDEVERKRLYVKWGAQFIEEFDDNVLVRWIQDGVLQDKADLLIRADGIWSAVRLG